ncbi:MAG: GerAB/ArcD/ProY family transporter [Christensenellaceae bacterium]|nr:GerAB/ArcD/ProY family transporter [Christensenellaceae bacterium]
MNLKEGRMGMQEGVSLAATAMAVSGLFTLDQSFTYSKGNSSYVTLPVAAILSLFLYLILIASMRRSGSRNLSELLKNAFGSVGASIASLVLFLCFIIAAYSPIGKFIQSMHALYYNGVTYGQITLFVLPTVLIIAWLGFETIGRAAKCFVGLMLLITAINIVSAVNEFEVYRLYPILGGDLRRTTELSFSEMACFLPGMVGLLVTCNGLNGVKSAKKTGIIAALVAAGVCFVAQFALSLIYTYSELQQLFMPLYRLNHLNRFETQLLRMDKLAQMAWLNGCMLAGSFYIYAGSLLFTQSFGLKDIRPPMGSAAVLTMIVLLFEFDGVILNFQQLRNISDSIGFVVIAVPLLIAAFIALLKKKSGGALKEGSKV